MGRPWPRVRSSSRSPLRSPDNGQSNQRILGDYVQVHAVGCSFYGTYPSAGTSSVKSIDPYFMKAPAVATCSLPTLTGLDPGAVCAGSGGFDLILHGTGFSNGVTGRFQGALRRTTHDGPTQATMAVQAADVATPRAASVDLLGAAPAGGLTSSGPLVIEAPAGSPGNSLRVSKGAGTVQLDWSASAGAGSYNVKRCTASGPCVPTTIASPVTNAYQDGSLEDGNGYWYLIDSVNSCGAVP